MKLVKPIKTFCSWPPDEGGLDQLLASETKPDIRTAAAWVLRETDATVGQELGRLDLPDSGIRFPQNPCSRDRKSTRLNSSHRTTSYAVFCLKKKKKTSPRRRGRATACRPTKSSRSACM